VAQVTDLRWASLGSNTSPVHREFARTFCRMDRRLLTALLPRRFEFGRGDVPVRPAFPGNATQVLAEIFESGPAEDVREWVC
jgi:hypothetical protein